MRTCVLGGVAGMPEAALLLVGVTMRAWIRQSISVMPESPGLYLRLTVAENLECFAGLSGLSDARQSVDRVLRAVNLAERANEPCGKLSKGLRQRSVLPGLCSTKMQT